MCRLIFFIYLMVFIHVQGFAQSPYNLHDARIGSDYCRGIEEMLLDKPQEVLFGIDINSKGEIIFSVNSKEWFEKIFSVVNGVTADIVSKEIYNCNIPRQESSSWHKGFVIKPLYKQDFQENTIYTTDQYVSIKLGTLPSSKFNGKELEANLILLNGDQICYYSNFVNIPRSNWALLPMGFYTDSIVNINSEGEGGVLGGFLWTKKIQSVISFAKNQTSYNDLLLKHVYDSLQRSNYSVRKIEIRAYSSVEGSLSINEKLMQARADAMIKGFKRYDPQLKRTKVVTAENWIEFFEDIKGTSFEYLADLSKIQIKQKLKDPLIISKLEPILSKHRKAILIIYLDGKSQFETLKKDELKTEFEASLQRRDIERASVILSDVWEQIADKKLPEDFLNSLEVPLEETFASLINKKEVYRYLLNQTSAFEAIELLEQVQKLKPKDGRTKYNLATLHLLVLRTGEEIVNRDTLLIKIQKLKEFKIPEPLVKRLLINFYILKSSYHYDKGEYELKDTSLVFIRNAYADIDLSDDDVYALAKYFAYYSLFDWAEEIIKQRVDKLDVNEDVLFYYINLCFYHPEMYESEQLNNAMLNAVNINVRRFCNFFRPNDKGGASMQLLDYEVFRSMYCDNCVSGAKFLTAYQFLQTVEGN